VTFGRSTAGEHGKVRSARKIPHTPRVSAIVWRNPYRAGVSKQGQRYGTQFGAAENVAEQLAGEDGAARRGR